MFGCGRGLELIELFAEFLKLEVGVDYFADAFAGVSLDLAAHSFVETFFIPHGGEGMAGVIRRVLSDVALFVFVLQNAHIAEQGNPIAFGILTVVGVKTEACAVSLSDQIFGAFVHPMLEEREHPFMDGDFADSIVVLTLVDIERLFLKIDAIPFYGEQLARANTGVDQHQDKLNVLVARSPAPEGVDLRIIEAVMLVALGGLTNIQIFNDVLILANDLILDGVVKDLVKHDL